jgi:hypothetical protein
MASKYGADSYKGFLHIMREEDTPEARVEYNEIQNSRKHKHPDNSGGLKCKYNVEKLDGTPVFDCFVLRPQKDSAARMALRAYAAYTPNQELKKDIYAWLDELEKESIDNE